MQPPDISILIVNYNGRDDLLHCLRSLEVARNEVELEVLAVDNGSTDGSIESVASRFPWVRILVMGQNLGFAAACNRGLEQARGRHVMLLNPDTELHANSLTTLVRALHEHPEWGIVGPRMVDQDEHPYPSARRFPTPFFLFCECTRLIYIFPHSRLFAQYFYGDRQPDSAGRVDQIEGSALAISGTTLHAVGPLDERFFLFFEEVDWCKRVWEAGFEVRIVPEAVVRHYRATTMSRFYVESRRAHARSALAFFDKHYGSKGVRSLRRWMLAALAIRLAATACLSLFGKRDLARLRFKGARAEWKVYRSGLGP
jgi:N-acetylglucosaminyl-diphospho-decaprenol L-rhamnosyltransferase